MLNAKDYPKDKYDAYWEVFIDDQSPKFPWEYRVVNRSTNKVVRCDNGVAASKQEALLKTHQEIAIIMEDYKLWP